MKRKVIATIIAIVIVLSLAICIVMINAFADETEAVAEPTTDDVIVCDVDVEDYILRVFTNDDGNLVNVSVNLIDRTCTMRTWLDDDTYMEEKLLNEDGTIHYWEGYEDTAVNGIS